MFQEKKTIGFFFETKCIVIESRMQNNFFRKQKYVILNNKIFISFVTPTVGTYPIQKAVHTGILPCDPELCLSGSDSGFRPGLVHRLWDTQRQCGQGQHV